MESFKEWKAYFKLSVPATVMLCAEWWSFEILVILVGILGVIEQAAFIITLNVTAQCFMFPMGI